MESLFLTKGKLNLNKNKQTLLFFDDMKTKEYDHIFGTRDILKTRLKEQYNIITIGLRGDVQENFFKFNGKFSDNLLRKKQDENYLHKNISLIEKCLTEELKDIPNIQNVFILNDMFFILPLRSYCSKKYDENLANLQNEFFDYIGNDDGPQIKINKIVENICNNWIKTVSPIAFSTKLHHIMPEVLLHLYKKGKIKGNVMGFIIDPAFNTTFLKYHNIPFKALYFENDFRGTRKYHKWDTAQIQHIIYDKEKNNLKLNGNKTKNFFFTGTIFQDKGTRSKTWNKFFKNMTDNKSSFFIPLRKGGIISKGTKENQKNINILKEKYKVIYDEIINHPLYKSCLFPHNLNEEIKKYKYGMVLKCISHNDSLNFKPILYTLYDILPFLDPEYDPSYIQIPKKIQDFLVVKNSKEIEEKIKYFNSNENKRSELLFELKKIFKIEEYLNNPDKELTEQIKILIPNYKG